MHIFDLLTSLAQIVVITGDALPSNAHHLFVARIAPDVQVLYWSGWLGRFVSRRFLSGLLRDLLVACFAGRLGALLDQRILHLVDFVVQLGELTV